MLKLLRLLLLPSPFRACQSRSSASISSYPCYCPLLTKPSASTLRSSSCLVQNAHTELSLWCTPNPNIFNSATSSSAIALHHYQLHTSISDTQQNLNPSKWHHRDVYQLPLLGQAFCFSVRVCRLFMQWAPPTPVRVRNFILRCTRAAERFCFVN